jgi:23S rRNA pseudouridine2605 synthase
MPHKRERAKKLKTSLPRPPQDDRAAPAREAERIAKVMARAGLCSRREAEAWIIAGRVSVNGAPISSPALDVTARDKITVDGKPLPQRERTRLLLYNKPPGLVTTSADPQGRPTIFGGLPKDLPRLISVGRLDLNTEGLLLLTNDGGLARVLELPQTGWLRRYRVRAFGKVMQPQLDALRKGVEIDGVRYGAIEASVEREQGSNVWLTFAIREGKNREVRNVLRHLGLHVNRLIRVSFGPFQLGELASGHVEEVKTRILREQLGERIVALSGADFSAEIVARAVAPRQSLTRPAAPAAILPKGGRDKPRPMRREKRKPGHSPEKSAGLAAGRSNKRGPQRGKRER